MKKHILCLVLISFVSSFSFAQENLVKEEPMPDPVADGVTSEPVTPVAQGVRYSCSNSGIVRRVEVEYESADSTLPCSVNYYKDNEVPGHNATLWRAEKAEGFCESKAAEFAEKLRTWGWACTES